MFEINPRLKHSNPGTEVELSPSIIKNAAAWRLGLPFQTALPHPKQMPVIIAVGGGKGGVGKSIVSANLGTNLAQFGYRVLVIDLDLGCSNLHSHFGIAMPKKSLADFLLNKTAHFADVMLPAPAQGVAFIAGGREEIWGDFLESSTGDMLPLWQAIANCRQQYKVDIVVLDLGAGTHRYTMNFFTCAHLGIVTCLPETTSIENAYVFFKMTLWKMIDNVGQRLGQAEIAQDIKAALASMAGGSLASGYASCFRQLQMSYPLFIQELQRAIQARQFGIVINQARDQSDIDLGTSMEHICQKYFGMPTRYVGYLNYDEAVLKSLKNRRLLVSDFPHSMISKRLSIAAAQALKILGMQRRN